MRQPWVVRTLAALLMTTALVGCKSGKSTPSNTTPAAVNGTAAPAAATCVVPQNNGGDHDADNNGGPDDGDGCDK
jgi:hypothetical protein